MKIFRIAWRFFLLTLTGCQAPSARAHHWLMFNLPTRTPRSFLQDYFPAGQPPVNTGCAGLHIFFLCCILKCQPISPACRGPSGWQHSPQVYLNGVLLSECRALHFLNFMRFLSVHFSSLRETGVRTAPRWS